MERAAISALPLPKSVFKLAKLCRNGRFKITTGFKFTNHRRRFLVVAQADEGAMTQVPGVRPFDECDSANQLRFARAVETHFGSRAGLAIRLSQASGWLHGVMCCPAMLCPFLTASPTV